MELITLIFQILLVSALFWAGAYTALKSADAEIRKLGMTLLAGIMTGALGFMAGRGTK